LRAGTPTVECSLDLDRSTTTVEWGEAGWTWEGQRFPYPETCKDRTIYHWDGEAFQPVARFATSLIKFGAGRSGGRRPSKSTASRVAHAQVSPYADAERKVALIQPRAR